MNADRLHKIAARRGNPNSMNDNLARVIAKTFFAGCSQSFAMQSKNTP